MAQFVGLAAVSLCLSLVGGMFFGDPCTVQPWGSQLTEDGGEVTVPANCLNGSIWWNYPRGILQVTWSNAQEFTVCLSARMGPLLTNISQVVDSRVIPVDNPQVEGEKTCLPEADTKVVALLYPPPYLAYMTLYEFTLVFQPVRLRFNVSTHQRRYGRRG